MLHVDEGLLHAYLDGELAGAQGDQVLAHLGECAACRTRLDEERALVARAGELLARAAPPRREPAAFARVARSRAPSWGVPAAWAATVTIAFAVGWYAQGERLAHELAGRATQPEVSAPAPLTNSPPADVEKSRASGAARRSGERTLNATPREDAARPVAAPTPRAAAPPIDAEAAALRDEAAVWPALDAEAARAVLGRAPAVLRGRAIRRITRSPTDARVVLIEQEWKPGIVLRLYEQRALNADERARSAAPSAQMAPREENLARYVSSLRVEIGGPLPSDSLAQILDSIE
jgi:predicted anti-sigma-YlaC factor YlaD